MSRLASSAQPIHICFYSNRCEWSKAFITELAQTPYKGEFRFVCVDPSPTRPTLPSWLKKVPTLVINGEPEPRTDNEVLNWLYERKMKDGKGGSAGASSGGAVAAGGLEPEPYMDTEMGGNYGDQYSFLDMDTSTGGNGGMSISHNFSYLGGDAPAGGAGIGTKEGSSFQTTDMSGKRSKKEEMLDKQMEAYMKARDSGVPKGPARM
jgi:hypothetical protein